MSGRRRKSKTIKDPREPLSGPTSMPTEPAPKPESDRIERLEKNLADVNNRVFDAHKWFVTVMFSLVFVALAAMGILSKLDVRDSIKVMEDRADRATREMKAEIHAVIGDALK